LPALGQILDPPRRSTPTIPPGLFPHGSFPPIGQDEDSSTPVTPTKTQKTKVEKRKDASAPEPALPKPKEETPVKQSRAPIGTPVKAEHMLTTKKNSSKEEKKQAPPAKIATPKPIPMKSVDVKETEPLPNVEPSEPAQTSPIKVEASDSKRAHPGKLKIPTMPLTEKDFELPVSRTATPKPDALTRTSRAASITTPSFISRPGTPVAAGVSTGSPIRRTTQPRTLRITETPRTETPPPIPASPTVSTPTTTPAITTMMKQTSRRPSITSTNQPGTPMSERVDMFSVTSASASRASSPPPIITNRKAKKEAKKQRQKEKETEIAVAVIPKDTAEEHAPIMARKTKSKKSKPTGSTPALKAEAFSVPEKAADPVPVVAEKEPEPKPQSGKLSGKGKAKAASPPPKPQPVVTTPIKEEPKAERTIDFRGPSSPKPITAAAILAALESTHQLALTTLSLLKPLTQQSELRRLGIDPFTSVDLQNHIEQLRFELTKADEQLLKQGQAVRKDLSGDGRISGRNLVTPERTRLACLTKEEEDKYLEIEKRVKESKGISKWGGAKAGKKRTENVMKALTVATETLEGALRDAQLSQQQSAKGRGVDGTPFSDWNADASDYVNQFVPPSIDGLAQSASTPKSSGPQIQPTSSQNHDLPSDLMAGSSTTAGTLAEAMATAGAIASGKDKELLDKERRKAAATSSGGMKEAEKELQEQRRETDALEKKYNALVKKNRKIVGLTGGSSGVGH
jgi:hypothetical protein